jgi:hypothetical protein
MSYRTLSDDVCLLCFFMKSWWHQVYTVYNAPETRSVFTVSTIQISSVLSCAPPECPMTLLSVFLKLLYHIGPTPFLSHS